MSDPEVNTLETTSKPRKVVILLLVLWLVTLAALVGIAWNAYLGQKEDNQTLAEQVQAACEQGDLGVGLSPDDNNAGLSPEDERALCDNAQKVIDENDPELQDDEIQEDELQESEDQEPEIQEPEIQNPEDQNPEDQNPEAQEGENQEAEEQEGEAQEPENQDPEEQEPEIQDDENQDPEVDDPDPASPYEFTFTFTIPGSNPSEPDRTYTVTCNSGTGNCTVQQS